jgi:AMP nucleosidase
LPAPGVYETTLTRPDLFGRYFSEQFRLLVKNHAVKLEVGLSAQPIPIHFALSDEVVLDASFDESLGGELGDHFDLPNLATMDDTIANGSFDARLGEPHPLALFTAPRVDYSLHRLRHYTGTSPGHFQNFVLFTNYQFYIDEFIRIGRERVLAQGTAGPDDYVAFVEPGNRHHLESQPSGQISIRCADDSGHRAGAPSADAGVPSSAGRPQWHHHGQHRHRPVQRADITDHIAVLRPTPG